jgi:glycosyltransferase involved in cell wall biosynthesis
MVDTLAISSVVLTCLVIVYSTAIFPALLSIAARLLRRQWIQSSIEPRVSVIIPVHNEQAIISRKLDNILATKYLAHAFEVLVASDCSTDETDAIVHSYESRVRLVRAAARSGKQVCLNLAAAEATGEILLFTDAAGLLAPDAIELLVRHFADPSIGAVSSAVRVERDSAEGEGMYLGADCALRVREGEVSSIVGCVGACYAMRRECFTPFHPADCDDFAAVFSVVACGKRAIMDPKVVCTMLPARDAKAELVRKVRTMAGALDTVWRYRRKILCSAPPSLLWFIASHKVCRWLSPLLVCWSGLAVTSGALFGNWSWRIPFAAGLFGAGIGLVAVRFSWQDCSLRILKPFGFCAVSLCAGLIAWWKVLAGNKQVVWQPTPRAAEPCSLLSADLSLQSSNVDCRSNQDFDAEPVSSRCASAPSRVLAALGEKSC